MTWLIVQVHYTLKTILNYRGRLDRVQFVMKTKQENDMIDRTVVLYIFTILNYYD